MKNVFGEESRTLFITSSRYNNSKPLNAHKITPGPEVPPEARATTASYRNFVNYNSTPSN